jgi:hypothetical protein
VDPTGNGAPRPSVAGAQRAGVDEGDEHDRALILERLRWSVEERLDANASFLRFYLAVRPHGPLVGGE